MGYIFDDLLSVTDVLHRKVYILLVSKQNMSIPYYYELIFARAVLKCTKPFVVICDCYFRSLKL